MQCCNAALFSTLLLWLLVLVEGSTMTSVKKFKKNVNGVVGVETSCSGESLTVIVNMEQRFQGAIHAKGFPVECRAVGQGETFVQLTVAASSCGLRITPHKDGGFMYHLLVEVQTTRHLQQATDISIPASCYLPRDQIKLHSPAINSLKRMRSGRNMKNESENASEDSDNDDDGTAKAWLEIQGSGDSEVKSVIVGEHTTLRLKALLPEGVDSRVVDCIAHDGAGESSQQLVDAGGCPVDGLLVPAFKQTITQFDNSLRLHQHSTSFPAFKFPDRSALHIRCGLMICAHACSLLDCSTPKEDSSRSDRRLNDVIDHVQLFNSIEVVAPGIETDDLRRFNHLRHESGDRLESDSGEEPLCLPATKTAVSLACAGVMFLMVVAASLCVIIRGRICQADLTDERNRLLLVPSLVW